MDVIQFTEWLLEVIERAPAPTVRSIEPVPSRDLVTAIDVVVPGPGNPSLDKTFRIRVEER